MFVEKVLSLFSDLVSLTCDMSEGTQIDVFRVQQRHWTTDRGLGVISIAIKMETEKINKIDSRIYIE